MNFEYTQAEANKLIIEKIEEFGDVSAALGFVHNHILNIVEESEPAPSIPNLFPLSSPRLTPGKLCRCRGMIQEVEPSLSLYRASCSNFFDITGRADTVMLEATLLYVIPVPGNTHFYPMQQENVGEEPAATVSPPSVGSMSIDRKRRERPGGQLQGADVERLTKQFRGEKLLQSQGDPKQELSVPLYHQLNLPHPPLSGPLHTACIVTVIQHSASERQNLRLNDVVDFFGFLEDSSSSGGLQSAHESDEFEGFGAWHAEELSSIFILRMICISWRHVHGVPARPIPQLYFENRRPLVLQYLTKTICQGDALLAEYILLHLCARVISHESATPIGDVPLRVEAQVIDPESWSTHMRSIVAVGEVLLGEGEVSNANLCIAPRQDYTENVLRTGVLQLANGTHVTLDCHAISKATGALHDVLFSVIHKQVLPLEYPYQVHELPVDLSFLALSTVRASEEIELLRFAVSVRWMPESSMDAGSLSGLLAEDVRNYFAQVRCLCRSFDRVDLPRTLCLADRLVSFSNSEPLWNNHDSLIHNNSFSMAASLMRAQAASLGRSVIVDDDVEHVLLLEGKRVTRCL